MILYDEEREKQEAENKAGGVPPEDAVDAAPPIVPFSRKKGRQRGLYGTRLSKQQRDLLLRCIREGGTFAAAAASIGRDRSTIERWRIYGREGRPGYARLYLDMEEARGYHLMRLHNFTAKKATEETADGRLALALLDRHDPEFRELRSARRQEASVEVVTAAGVQTDGAAGAKVATRVTYSLSWDDGSPVRFPGLHGVPLALPAGEPGGNGGRPKAIGRESVPHESADEDDADHDEIG